MPFSTLRYYNAFFQLQHGVLYTSTDSSQPPLVPWLEKVKKIKIALESKQSHDQILSQNICILYSIGPNNSIWCFLTSLTHIWPISVKSVGGLESEIKPSLTLLWFDEIILNSKYMYIWYIPIKRPDLTPIGRIWPKFDLWWPLLTLRKIKSEFLRKFLFQTNVYWIDLDNSARFDPNSMIWPNFDFWWPLIGHNIFRFGFSNNFRSFKAYVIKIGPLSGAIEPFSDFCQFCSRAPPRDRHI